MKKIFFAFIFIIFSSLSFAEEPNNDGKFDFIGKHFIASYYGCDQNLLNDREALNKIIISAIEASGATILEIMDYQFDPQGLTIVALLSESHASIHTYPEHGACFVDLFTCGLTCDASKFDEKLCESLKATSHSKQTIVRN